LGETGTTGVNEIDIHELLGNALSTVYLTVHWGPSYTSGHQSDSTSYVGPDFSADFHTFAVDWDADRVIWYVDGVERFRHSGVGVPQVEMYVIANLAIGGTWPGAPNSTTSFPANYDVDYIRVYRKLAAASDAGSAVDAAVPSAIGDAGISSSATNGSSCGCRMLTSNDHALHASGGLMLFASAALARWRRRGPRQ
jgi:beta-glucanase (GH16 family)